MKLIPLAGRIFLKPSKKDNVSAQGEGKKIGIVEWASDQAENLKQGDKVLYTDYDIDEVTLNHTKYIIADLKHVIAKIEMSETQH